MLKKVFLTAALTLGLSSVALADINSTTNIVNWTHHTIEVTMTDGSTGQPVVEYQPIEVNGNFLGAWNYAWHSIPYFDKIDFYYVDDYGNTFHCLNGVYPTSMVLFGNREIDVNQCDDKGFSSNPPPGAAQAK